MPNKRDLKLDKYNIDKYQYRELHNFCLQYSKKKQKADSLLGAKGVAYTGMPGNTEPGNPTAKAAEMRAKLLADCKIIEESAKEADPSLYKQIIANVTEQIPFEFMGVPCGRRQFYEIRRKFFFILAHKRNMV